jgi:antitoxin HicB
VTELEYPAAIHKINEEDGGGYIAFATDLKGCVGDGDTPEAALLDLRNAILEWIDEARKLNRPIPKPGDAFINALNERKNMVQIIKKQDELIKEQSKAFESLHKEIDHLREQVSELAESRQVEAEPLWGYADVTCIVDKKARSYKNEFQH